MYLNKSFLKIVFCLSFVFINSLSHTLTAQLKIPVAAQTDISKFLKSKTYVVLKNDDFLEYNAMMRNVIEKFWKLTEYEFIYERDFNSLKKNSKFSFLMINQVYFEKDKQNHLFDFIILTLGGNYKSVNDMPTLCAIPLCYYEDEEENYVYKLGVIIKFIQLHINTCKNNNNLTQDNIADYYMKTSGSLANKTLYLVSDDIEIELRNKTNFSNYYPYSFELSSKEGIAEKILNDRDSILILHLIKADPKAKNKTFCFKIIVDAHTGFICYYDMDKITNFDKNYLLKSDLKKLKSK